MNKHDELVITNPFTGRPFTVAPDGTDMDGVTFKTKEERKAFIAAHWPEAVVEMVEVPVK